MRIILSLLLTSTLLSCDLEDSWLGIGRPAEEQLTVGLTVAPVDIAEKIVLILHGLSFQAEDGQTTRFDFDTPLTIDLLDLQSSRERLLDQVRLKPGRFTHLQLLARGDTHGIDAYVIPKGDTQAYPLLIPDHVWFGIDTNFLMPEQDSQDLTLVFDLRRGLTGSASQGAFEIRPTFRLVETNNAGTIAGLVDERLWAGNCSTEGNAVYVFTGTRSILADMNQAHDEPFLSIAVRTSASNQRGRYEFGYLPRGAYTLTFTCQADRDSPFQSDNISYSAPLHRSIQAGSVTEANFTN